MPRVRARGDSVVYLGRAYNTLSWLGQLHVDALTVSRLYRRVFGGWTATAADWQLEADVVSALRRTCEVPGTNRRFLFILLPGGIEESDVAPVRAAFVDWKRELSARRIPVVDLNVPFDSLIAAEGGPRRRYFYHDTHPGPEYAGLIGYWIADAVESTLARPDGAHNGEYQR